jgi:hypothetical protein
LHFLRFSTEKQTQINVRPIDSTILDIEGDKLFGIEILAASSHFDLEKITANGVSHTPKRVMMPHSKT